MVLRSPEGWDDGDPRRDARPGSSDGSSAGWHLAMPGARLGPFLTQASGDGSQDYPSYSWGTEVCPWKWQHKDSPIDPEIAKYFLTRILKTFCATCKLRTWLEPGEFPRAPVTPSVLALLGRLFCLTPGGGAHPGTSSYFTWSLETALAPWGGWGRKQDLPSRPQTRTCP